MNAQGLLHDAYIALGSNIGDREGYLTSALRFMEGTGMHVSSASPIYETVPVGYADQPLFLNMACRVQTALSAPDLLAALQLIEQRLKRKRIIRWGPRTVDLDLLLYDDIAMGTETLTVPHPRMFERAFVLIPLRDVYPAARIRGRAFAELIAACGDRDGVKPYENTPH